jgi:hypothetical protein
MNTIEGVYNESQEMMLSVAKKFFDSFSMGFGYYGGNSKESIIKMYVPALSMMTYDGFYMYTLDYVKDNAGDQYLEHTLKPEVKYAYDDGTSKINFTLDNTVILNEPIQTIDYSDPVSSPIPDEFGNPIGYEQEDDNGVLIYNTEAVTNTGKVVDLDHYYDIEKRSEGVGTWTERIGDYEFTFSKMGNVCYTTNRNYSKYNGDGTLTPLTTEDEYVILYEKSFYMLNGQRYLLEEWRKDNPYKTAKECISSTGISSATVYRYWKNGEAEQ